MLKNLERQLFGVALLLVCCLVAPPAGADIVAWTGGSNNDWFVSANWNPAQTPTNGDEVVITNGTVLLTNSTPYLSSFTIANATLTFANWSTKLSAGNVVISAGGTLTLPAAFTNNAMSNRVWIACSNITIETGGSIVADGKGYAYGTPTIPTGQGPGGGPSQGDGTGGGGHGGNGGSGYAIGGGGTYGSAAAPLCPGSGGGGSIPRSAYGAHGGGAALIEAAGAVVVHGTISANGNATAGQGGETGSRGGGGSGGAIYITCNTFAGTNGVIRADGGAGGIATGGAGGGGRIAVMYETNAQASLSKPTVRFSANRALGYGNAVYSGIGTLYFPDMALMDYGWMAHNGVLNVTNFTSWSVPSLLVTNGFIRIPTAEFVLRTTNDLVIVGTNGILQMPTGGDIACGRDLILTNGGQLYIYSAATNDTTPDYGALVDVEQDLLIAANSWLYPSSQNTNGAAPVFRMRDIVIAAGGGINANTLGFLRGINSAGYSVHGYGPGHGWASVGDGSGAGYGGRGGRSLGAASRGTTYGSSNAPALPGSGGAGRTGYSGAAGGNGGGLVRVEAIRNVIVDGTITADGQKGQSHGGGSGGGIYISCLAFKGATSGLLSADGGDRYYATDGAGGGGRIAVWRVPSRHYYTGSFSVTNGLSYTNDAQPGTVVFVDIAEPGMVLMIR